MMLHFTEKHLNKVRQCALEVQKKQTILDAKLAELPQNAQKGDIFLLSYPKTMGVQWAIVDVHPKDKNWLLTVPADDLPLVGSNDIPMSPKSLYRSLTLRCGKNQGLWIHKNNFDMTSRVGILEEWDLKRTLEKITLGNAGKIQSTAMQAEIDIDPEYQKWMNVVHQEEMTVLEHSTQIAVPQKSIISILPRFTLLGKWLKGKYAHALKTNQQLLEKILDVKMSIATPAFAFQNAPSHSMAVKLTKQVFLSKEHPLNLEFTIEQQENETIKANLCVSSLVKERRLPNGMKLIIIPEAGPSVEKEADSQKRDLMYTLSGLQGERFNIKIVLGQATFTEQFVM
ncbi:MAG: DUF1822 family protein [Thiomargarita sp.]|nr:DUF1822 family protein [Thiomargarita sp.]